jgi:hypothetical protein
MICNGIINKNIRFLDVEYSQDGANAPVVGDMVSTTTSKFEYCSMSHQFMNCDSYAKIVVFPLKDDYSKYNMHLCEYGGAYGYNFYIVASVLSVVEDIEYVVSCDIQEFQEELEELEEAIFF